MQKRPTNTLKKTNLHFCNHHQKFYDNICTTTLYIAEMKPRLYVNHWSSLHQRRGSRTPIYRQGLLSTRPHPFSRPYRKMQRTTQKLKIFFKGKMLNSLNVCHAK